MARRMSIICRHMSAGAGRSPPPDTPKISTFRCPNGLVISTKVWGDLSSDRKALALHGFLDNAGSFDLLGPALAKEGFCVVAMDFPGHGRSAHMGKDNWYALLDYPEYVIEAASWLGWNRFSLVGHSMGGAVASLVAASFPELVERCVSIDILGPYTFSPGSSPKLLRRSIESRRALIGKERKPYVSLDEAVRQRLKAVSYWGEGQTLSWDGARRLVAGGSEPWQEEGQLKFTNDIRLRASNSSFMTEESVLRHLEAIKCPFLVVRGQTGMVTDTPAFLERKAVFDGRLRDLVLPGSHHLHLDDGSAALVALHVASFLRGRDMEAKGASSL